MSQNNDLALEALTQSLPNSIPLSTPAIAQAIQDVKSKVTHHAAMRNEDYAMTYLQTLAKTLTA